MDSKRRLVVFNCLLLISIELFINVFISCSVDSIVMMQQWAKFLNIENTCWFLSETLGPQPRIVTMVMIMLFASTGEEATRWLTLRFLTTYSRWVLGMLLKEPRPSWISEDIDMLHCPVSYGLPSGHAMLLGSLSFSFACWRTNKWLRAMLICWFTVMCMGRLYLGTHSIHDLLLGTTLGINIALFVHEPKFVPMLEAFFYEQGFWFVAILFCFGVSASFGFVQLLSKMGDAKWIHTYAMHAKANGCHVPTLYDPLEGVVAISALCGLLFSLSVGRIRLEPFVPKRLLALLVFLIPSVWKAESQAFLVEVDFPYHSQMFILGACNLISVILLFTSQSKNETREVASHQAVLYGTITNNNRV